MQASWCRVWDLWMITDRLDGSLEDWRLRSWETYSLKPHSSFRGA